MSTRIGRTWAKLTVLRRLLVKRMRLKRERLIIYGYTGKEPEITG